MSKFILDSLNPHSPFELRDFLSSYLKKYIKENRHVIFLCIGTDRSTGDSLGPLIGHKLKFLHRDCVSIIGTLENPVHAKNLVSVLNNINSIYNNPYIIAIDACLGSLPNVGKILIDEKPLFPGSAVNKDLPPVGDLSISGVVNISGTMEFMVLQNTRLHLVMQLAETISQGIYHSILKSVGGKNTCNEFYSQQPNNEPLKITSN